MDTRSLLYFIAVAEEKNLSRAALRLHITQPALTRQIHSLEDEVGVPLFLRTTTGMEITGAGTALLQHARTIQAELEQAKVAAKSAKRRERQPFGIGVFGSAIFTAVPRLLAEFSGRNPQVELCLHQVRKDQQLALLRQGKIQIVFDRFLQREPDMAYETVCRERLWVALHKDHPLAAKEIVDIGDLSGEPRVGSACDIELESKIAQVYGSFMPRLAHRADNILTVLALVSAGLCVGFAPPSLRAINIPNVVYRPCAGASKMPFDLMCMCRKDDHSPLLTEMREVVRAFCRASENESAGIPADSGTAA